MKNNFFVIGGKACWTSMMVSVLSYSSASDVPTAQSRDSIRSWGCLLANRTNRKQFTLLYSINIYHSTIQMRINPSQTVY